MRAIIGSCMIIGALLLWSGCEKEEEKVCTNSFVDARDGQEYCIVSIGNQTWMAENLRYQTDSNSYLNPLNPSTVNMEYGRLYTFSEALTACPNGWHLPTDEEWKSLEMELGMTMIAANGTNQRGVDEGRKLKATAGWDMSTNSDVEGTNSSGFKALPSGERNPSYGPYFELGKEASFWTATEYDTTGGAWMRSLSYDHAQITRNYFSQSFGYSCRCVQD